MAAPLIINGVEATLFVGDGDGSDAIVESWPLQGGATAKVRFKCAWEDRYRLITGLFGTVRAAGNKVIRTPPFRYPDSTNLRPLTIDNVKGIKFRTRADGWGSYESAVLDVGFGIPNYQTDGQDENQDPADLPYSVTTVKVSVEVFSPPIGAYYYTAGTFTGTAVEESSIGIPRSRAEINVKRKRMPFVPLDMIMADGGVVNSNSITLADMTFLPGTVLFVSADVGDPYPDPVSGTLVWDITYVLLGNNSLSWNKFMDKTGAYVTINTKADGSGSPPFASQDLSWIFVES